MESSATRKMHIRRHLSELGSNLSATKKDRLNNSITIDTMLSVRVESSIYEQGKLSIITAIVTKSHKKGLSNKNLSMA